MSYALEKVKCTLRDNILPGFLFRLLAAIRGVPDGLLYSPTFQPWRGDRHFCPIYDKITGRSLVSRERAWILYSLARNALNIEGDFVECGVYRGGTARLLRRVLDEKPAGRRLHLFDTFLGMPDTDRQRDKHKAHDFADTSLDAVSAFVGRASHICYHPGRIPETFRNAQESHFAFSHIDVDIYRSVLDCCLFIYPRTPPGGIIIFDDYGFASCPGARQAVDEFFAEKPEVPLVLGTGQAVVFRVTSTAR